jgi:hypothetical protein
MMPSVKLSKTLESNHDPSEKGGSKGDNDKKRGE